ncbi:Late embryogenesis abundant (LEA) hydroxyproline-rich glycoprotein family [Striga hermonthica]|uniref:Late embryogenesis abundant (LEA) hydroxyproline-rich glycoprotein family n=1 Tax=Striga hermonthica TaxID=68872 RepID=A0A9N7RAX0_STRHE|nr:Late embryogenesis abundant (LEA) hydroxyproline-rich glycoprotein family [Striga hermonthica]
MGKSHKPSGAANLASCLIAAVFLIALLVAAAAVYFTVFKPRSPRISVNAVQVPAFSAANSTATFNFSQYITVRNPNRVALAHYGSALHLLRGGAQVGLLFVPAGSIAPHGAIYIAATFSVRSLPMMAGSGRPESVAPDGLGGFGSSGPSIELETRLEMAGRVRFLHFFAHHVESKVECTVEIGASDGSVLGLHCYK